MKKKTWNKNKKKKTMLNSYETVQTRKLISSYGGAGSIIETREGAIIVEPFSEWSFFKDYNLYKDEKNWIKDYRFIHRLKTWFKKLDALVEIPENDLKENGYPEKSAETISAKYFPEWMFCPKCKQFDKLENWYKHWNNEKSIAKYNDKDKFLPPKCFSCHSKAKDKKYRFTDLEQIRFVLTSPNGNIVDVPWDMWVFAEIKGKNDDESNKIYKEQIEDNEKRKFLDFTREIPKNIYFTYEVSDQYNNLKGISIIARSIDTNKVIGRNTLEGIFSLRVQEKDVLLNSNSKAWMKVVIRSSNSVYYPNILQSLFLPISESLDNFSNEEIEFLKINNEVIKDVSILSNLLQINKSANRTPEQIQKLIENDFIPENNILSKSNLEQDYRLSEYNFIVSKKEKYKNEEVQLSIELIEQELYDCKEIANIYRLDSLKMTAVQVSFTRQEPIDKDYFLQEDSDEQNKEGQYINKKYTSIYGNRTKYIPAIANIGEGIFIDFENKKIKEWIESNDEIQNRANIVQKNFDDTKLNQKEERITSPKLILLHTFSHLIIKELEFLSGYPATSLHERLYISNDMQGILIYTIAGAEGSYGGLVSVCKSKKIGEIIKSALHRATDCSSDPICYQTKEQGQGVGGTNLAACYSCALLPETSCEEFNRFLDRRLLIDDNYGYFKE